MPLELRPLAKEDAQEAAALLVASFKDNAFRAIVLPKGMSQASIDGIMGDRQKAVNDPNRYVLKVVDTEDNDKMAGCAVWEYTKAMTDEDWERAKQEAPRLYPEARHDIIDKFIAMEQDSRRRIMGHTRWLGEFALSLHIDLQWIHISTTDHGFPQCWMLSIPCHHINAEALDPCS